MSPLAHTRLSRPMPPPKKKTLSTHSPHLHLNYRHSHIQGRLGRFSHKHFKQNSSKSKGHKNNALSHYSMSKDSM